MRGYLACITSLQENIIIVNLTRNKPWPRHSCCWIGGKQNSSTDNWEWITKEFLELEKNLIVQENGEHYLNLRLESGFWEDYQNHGEQYGQQWFVCEWPSLESLLKNIDEKNLKP